MHVNGLNKTNSKIQLYFDEKTIFGKMTGKIWQIQQNIMTIEKEVITVKANIVTVEEYE